MLYLYSNESNKKAVVGLNKIHINVNALNKRLHLIGVFVGEGGGGV